jgi:Na+:H+ antiporter, NhaA family
MKLAAEISDFIALGPLGLLFVLAGLELRQEVLTGKFQGKKAIYLPLFSAIGGMIFPAIIYLAVARPNHAPLGAFGIPLATDLPLALLVLALLPKKISQEIRAHLLALAIFDDLLTILILTFSGKTASFSAIIGVLIGISIPRKVESRVNRFLAPLVNYLIVPLFLVTTFWLPWKFDAHSLGKDFSNPILYAVIIARVIGKPLGIFLFGLLAMKIFRIKLIRASHLFLIGLIGILGLSVAVLFARLTTAGLDRQAALLAILITIFGGFVASWGFGYFLE